jgi:hypothetical protein
MELLPLSALRATFPLLFPRRQWCQQVNATTNSKPAGSADWQGIQKGGTPRKQKWLRPFFHRSQQGCETIRMLFGLQGASWRLEAGAYLFEEDAKVPEGIDGKSFEQQNALRGIVTGGV